MFLRVENSPFLVNSYILYEDKKAIIIDPGEDFTMIDSALKKLEVVPIAVVNTHGHVDHVTSVEAFKQSYSIPFYMHSADQYLLDHLKKSCEQYGLNYQGTPEIEVNLNGMDSLELPPFKLGIIHTPGHTPGGICLKYSGDIFTGDTLFYRSIGRTDFPGGNHNDLLYSIKNNLYTLSDTIKIYPGHGPESLISEEIRKNPHTS